MRVVPTNQVKAELPQLQASLPGDVNVSIVSDRSATIDVRAALVPAVVVAVAAAAGPRQTCASEATVPRRAAGYYFVIEIAAHGRGGASIIVPGYV